MPFIERYTPKTLDREWGTETFIAETPHYLGKILKMRAGTQGGLQYHVEKDETFHLVSGQAIVEHELLAEAMELGCPKGELALTHITMAAGESYHIPPGTVHRVTAVTDCLFVETSTPHYDDRVHVEHLYGLPETGGLPTTRSQLSRG